MLSVLFLSAQFGVALTSILSVIQDLAQFAQNVRSIHPRWLLQILGLASLASLLRKLSWLPSRPLIAKSTSRNLVSCWILAFSSSILFLCSSIWACILILSSSICSGVILIISVGRSSNAASSNTFSSTMCSAIFLTSSCFLIEFSTFNSSFSPIFTISLFLSLSNFSMEGSFKKFSILSIFLQFFQTVISTSNLTVSTIFLFFLSRSPRVDLDGRNCHTTTSKKYYL